MNIGSARYLMRVVVQTIPVPDRRVLGRARKRLLVEPLASPVPAVPEKVSPSDSPVPSTLPTPEMEPVLV